MVSDTLGRIVRSLCAALLVLALVGSVQAQAAFENNPFFERTETLLRAHGLEMLSARLQGVEALASTESEEMEEEEEEEDGEDDLGEVIEALEVDFRRFAATLRARDAELAAALEEAIEAVEDAHEAANADEVAAAAGLAAGLIGEARQALFGDLYETDVAFAAAVMATMLTTENGGIGEGYEEAVEGEVGPYATAWAALDRVRVLWARIEPLANENQRFEVEDMFAELDALFGGPRPGPEVARTDPEEAEGSVQRIGGFLEEIVNADLFPSRDLGRLLTRTRELSSQACGAYEAGDEAMGLELISNAAFVYGEYLGSTLALFSPEAAGEADELYEALAPGAMGEEEGEEGGGDEEDMEEEEEAEPLTGQEAAEACTELIEQLQAAGGPLGI